MRTKNVVRLVLLCIGFGIVFPYAMRGSAPEAAAAWGDTMIYNGAAVTGLNRRLGEAVFNYAAPLGTAGFTHVAGHNPSGSNPITLTPTSPRSTVLATVADAAQLAFLGLTTADVDLTLENLPLQQVPTAIDPAGISRATLPPILAAAQDEASSAEPNEAITLGDWLKASARMTVRCPNHGPVTADLKLKKGLPNRIYTVWAVFGGASAAARPFGGTPNVIATDDQGDGRLKRQLNFCPFQLKPGERPLLNLQILLHTDDENSGAVAQLHNNGMSHIPGFVTHTHVEVPVTLAQ